MRKILVIAAACCAAVLAMGLAGCSGSSGSAAASSAASSSSSNAASSASSASASSSATVAGGWTVPADTQPVLSAEDKAVYDAAEGTDPSIEPVALLATQVVSGLNYAFLGKDTLSWYVLVCWKDAGGKTRLTSTKAIDLADVKTIDQSLLSEDLVGGWTVPLPETAATLPESAQAAFDKAQQGYTGVGFTPIALLGTQVVAGTNYMLLCDGTRVIENPAAELYVVTVYEDLKGNAEITSVEAFDLLYYIGN